MLETEFVIKQTWRVVIAAVLSAAYGVDDDMNTFAVSSATRSIDLCVLLFCTTVVNKILRFVSLTEIYIIGL